MTYFNNSGFRNQQFISKEESVYQKLHLLLSEALEMPDISTDYIIDMSGIDTNELIPSFAGFGERFCKRDFYNSKYFGKIILSLTTLNKFKKELANKKNLIEGKEKVYKDAFNYLLQAIIPLKPVNITPKITGTDSIYIKFLLDNRYLVRLELFLGEEATFDSKKSNVVLNIDENDEQIFGTHCIADKAINYLFKQIEDLPSASELTNTSDSINNSYLSEAPSNFSTSF